MDKNQAHQARQIIKHTFESPFNKDRFVSFIKNLLNQIEEAPFSYQGRIIRDSFKPYISKLERIGKYSDGEHKIDILVVRLQRETSLERARTMQRNFIAWYLNGSRGNQQKDAALVAFVSPHQTDWRFSLVKMDYKFEQSTSGRMKVKEEFTPARRWSFLVGANEKSHTAQSRLVNIVADDEHNPTLSQLEEAFNIETVTKEFFLEYRRLFIRTKLAVDKVLRNDPKVIAEFESKGVDAVNFSKKLLGQIIFLYFLQKKGWFGVERDSDWGTGSKKFLRELFDLSAEASEKAEKKHGVNFFNDYLEPLFYEALRMDRSHDDHYYSRFNCKIPFLNGGLFDPINNYDWVHTDINIPNELFSNNHKTKEGDIGDGIFDIFDRYNFTVIEDEPLEKEVAIDPELLGKAYEKFNAIRPDNFDEYLKALNSGKKGEENKFNKRYGVFYTPREIVHYMCQQSLINYLATELDGKVRKDAIEFLILDGEKFVEHLRTAKGKKENNKDYEGKYKENEYFCELKNYASQIDFLLANLKMCDPAVGSGAFPVGMMTEIVKARMFFVLTGCLKDEYINSHGEKTKRNPYNFKRDCIENSLYGVDIDPGAVEIAKLRLWLSLVVDEDDITNIKPLPNLDYKIVCGNSLLGLPDIAMMSEKLEKDLEKLKVDYFNETNPINKQNLRNEINTVFKKLLQSAREFSKDISDIDFDFRVHFSEVFHETIIKKDWKVFHITWVTHNSRRNENIAESKTEGTNPILLSLEDRNKIAKILSNRIIEKEHRVLALNVLDDHVHLLLVCEENEVSSIVGKLKGYSSYEFHRRTHISNPTDGNHTDSNHTVNRMVADDGAGTDDTTTDDRMVADARAGADDTTTDDRMVADADTLGADTSHSAESIPTYSDGTIRKLWAAKFSNTYMKSVEHFASTIEYIQNNHLKHNLPPIDFTIIQPALTPLDKAFLPIVKKGGFDIVIANPPYITIALGKKQKYFTIEMVKMLKERYKNVFEYKGNTYSLFFSRSIYLLNKQGMLTFITPNTLLMNSTFSKTREFILKQCSINYLLNINVRVFDEAEIGGNLITILSKRNNVDQTVKVKEINDLSYFSSSIEVNFINQAVFKSNDEFKFNLNPLSVVFQKKLYSNTLPLGKIVKFYQGVITGDNKKYLSNNKLDKRYKKILRGRDINKYYYNFNSTYLLFDKEKLWSNTNEEYFEYSQKLINRQTSDSLIAAYDDKGFFSLDSTHIQLSINDNYDLKYVLALFNSKLFTYIYNQIVHEEGRTFAQVKTINLKMLPIKIISNSEQKIFIDIADNILKTKQKDFRTDTRLLEDQIDIMVYKLYNLTYEEVKIIDPNIGEIISEEEYEKFEIK